MNSESMLQVKNISAHYGAVKALSQVSLEVSQGEIVCIIGANGAGKTTLLNVISGLHRASRGEVILKGGALPPGRAAKAVARGVVQCPEGRQVFAPLSVMDNLLLGAFLRMKKEKARVEKDLKQILEIFPILEKRKTQLAGTLSGGEQQMLALGRALMSRPKVLLLDEPSLGLAPLFVKEIFRIIASLPEQKTSVLLVEQNAHAALKTATRGYVMVNGRITQSGDTTMLLHDKQVAEAFLGAKCNKHANQEKNHEPGSLNQTGA